jgi:hypothetical protein
MSLEPASSATRQADSCSKLAAMQKNFAGVTSRQQCRGTAKRLSAASVLGADPYTEHTKKHLIPG